MLATAMTLGSGAGGSDAHACSAGWRQIVDVVAQAGTALDSGARERAFARLTEMQREIPVEQRRMSAASLSGRTADPRIVALFAADAPGVAAPILSRTVLTNAQWGALIPTMPPASRNILRNRRDLEHGTTALLARFAPGDLALPASDLIAPPAAQIAGVTQIRDLVDRIAAFRQRTPFVFTETRAAGFAFEASLNGIIDWIEGAPREALIGLSIAQAATAGEVGVDGGAAGAWRRRAPITDARLMVAGIGPAGGDWLISAAPVFNPRDGRFLGYRGNARRPQPGEQAAVVSSGRINALAPDLLRQLVHELRTPLNAIHGFAEMIERQMLGPAAHDYRTRAQSIMTEADRLVALVDDLDMAARLDTERLADPPGAETDLAPIVAALVAVHRPALAARGIVLVAAIEPTLAIAAEALVERMSARLLAAITGVAAAGETLHAALGTHNGRAMFSLTRPATLAGRDERALLDPEYGPDGDWPDAPLLGLGFTLRLVAKLATQSGGMLATYADRFELTLPSAALSRERPAAVVGPAGFEPAT